MHIHTHTYIHTHIYINTHTHTHMHILAHTHTHIHIHTHSRIHTCPLTQQVDNEVVKMSKKKQKKLSRLSVAELKQVFFDMFK